MTRPAWSKAVPLLVLAGLCAYANVYPKTLVFDDDAWIVDKPELDDPPAYFKAMEGRPLLAATDLVLHRLGRNNPLGHHVLNVLIHLAATLTLYGVVRRALLSYRFGDRFAGRAEYLAFAVALLWMLHPLQVQCVTYIIQRGESMAGLFYFLILYAMQRADAAAEPRRTAPPAKVEYATQEEADYADPPGPSSDRWLHLNWRTVPWYALAVLSLVLGFGSKEIMVTAPGAVILFDRIFLAPSIMKMLRRRWLFYLLFLAVWTGFTGWHFQRAAEASGGLGFKVETVTSSQYALTEAGVLIYYLRLAVWPRGMAIDYQGWPWSHTWAEAYPYPAIVLGILGVTAVLLFWRPAVGFVCAWFFLILIPTSSFMPIVDPVFEHRMYLSLATVAVLVVFLADWLLRLVRLGWLRPVALAAVAVALGVLTHLRNEEYRTRAAVWEACVEQRPDNVRARANLAQGLILDERPEEVIGYLDRAIELSPTDPTSLQNMGAALETVGRYQEAQEYYRRIRDYYPNDWSHWRIYGSVLLMLGNYEEAADNFAKAAELKPDEAAPHYSRAAALLALGRDDESAAEAARAAARNPEWTEIVFGLARNVLMDERLRSSRLARESALLWARLGRRHTDDPHPQHLDTLAMCYAANGDFKKAIEVSSEAVLGNPTGPWGSLHRDRIRQYRRGELPWE
jgi:tetratricopeptide (TPR) repeat protein